MAVKLCSSCELGVNATAAAANHGPPSTSTLWSANRSRPPKRNGHAWPRMLAAAVATHEDRCGHGAPRPAGASRRHAFEHDNALPVQEGAPLRLAAQLLQHGRVGLAEQGALDHHVAEALDLRRLVLITGNPSWRA
jgi:hypothetical protein